MSVSARNQLAGTVSAVTPGSVNDEVEITLESGAKLVSVITGNSRNTLGLEKGKQALALIKAPWVILATEDSDFLFSARNQFPGRITSVETGAVNANVHLQTDAGFSLTSVITNESVTEMALSVGSRVVALIKASSVLLAVKK